MEPARAILRVTERLYAATMADERWPAAVEAIADLLGGGGEVLLTEMHDDELLKIVALDVHTALGE